MFAEAIHIVSIHIVSLEIQDDENYLSIYFFSYIITNMIIVNIINNNHHYREKKNVPTSRLIKAIETHIYNCWTTSTS